MVKAWVEGWHWRQWGGRGRGWGGRAVGAGVGRGGFFLGSSGGLRGCGAVAGRNECSYRDEKKKWRRAGREVPGTAARDAPEGGPWVGEGRERARGVGPSARRVRWPYAQPKSGGPPGRAAATLWGGRSVYPICRAGAATTTSCYAPRRALCSTTTATRTARSVRSTARHITTSSPWRAARLRWRRATAGALTCGEAGSVARRGRLMTAGNLSV